jgi:hydrogenase nickel incorporation protein HypA/HybF
VHLKLGPFSGVVKEALASAYELAREGTPLEHARLVVEEVPAVVFCPACAVEQELPALSALVCPACGGPTPDLVRGRELEVVALEIDT